MRRRGWQRPSSENTNGLLRQYMPLGMDLSTHSEPDLDASPAVPTTVPAAGTVS